MNTNKLKRLVDESRLSKIQISKRCGFSRMTLENILNGGDTKVSTLKSLAKTLGISVGSLFEDDTPISNTRDDEIERYRQEITNLKRLLGEQKKSTRILVELDVDDDELVQMGLRDKIIQILNTK